MTYWIINTCTTYASSVVVDSTPDANPQLFPCCKCNLEFTQPEHLRQHIVSHEDRDHEEKCWGNGKLHQSFNLQSNPEVQTIDLTRECGDSEGKEKDETQDIEIFEGNPVPIDYVLSPVKVQPGEEPGEGPYKCEECGEMFEYDSVLKIHQLSHESALSFICEHCGKTFSQKIVLKRHVMTHTGEKPFTCDHCGRGFGRNDYLRKHVTVHTKDKPYECELCGKGFRLNDFLKKHLTTHIATNRYQCEQCGITFHHIHVLRKHIKTHNGDKPFECEHCGRSFGRLDYLQKHVSTHTKVKPYECELCGKNFRLIEYLRKHMKTLHQIC